jgi:hypothetical protein
MRVAYKPDILYDLERALNGCFSARYKRYYPAVALYGES